jgi:hypothetical protein
LDIKPEDYKLHINEKLYTVLNRKNQEEFEKKE